MADAQPHSEPSADVAGYVLGSLEPEEARAFADHLGDCPACQRELEALSSLPELLVDLPPSTVLPADLEDRVFAAVEAAATAEIVPITAARRRRSPRMLTAAAAAVVVVAAGLGVASQLRHRAPAPLATIALISADGGPARGNATIRSTPAGLTIDMTVTGLEPSPPGTMYTCWLVAGDDNLSRPDRVSVGSFVVRQPSATVTVHWTTAADLARFPHLGITREPSNGNPSRQGTRVLVVP